MTSGPVVLLDVDGVINLARFRSSKERSRLLREGGWFHRRPRDPFSDDRLLVNLRQVRPLVQGLAAAAELAWATTWGPEANDVFSPLLGLPELPVASVNHRNLTKAATMHSTALCTPRRTQNRRHFSLSRTGALSTRFMQRFSP